MCAGAVFAQAPYITLSGVLQTSNGLPAVNNAVNFKPSQIFFVAGTGVVVPSSTNCATSIDGSVVGTRNPLIASVVTPVFSGTLPIGNYYVAIAFYDAAGHITLVGPETVQQLVSTGGLSIAPPVSGVPSTAVGMKVYIGTTAGGETLQGQTVGSASFSQSVPLVSGAALPASNNTVCQQIANDAGWPTGTGYNVSMTDSNGNTLPGYPMQWQLLGPGTTINLSMGLPYYTGTVYFPSPVLASPLNHATQSISGPISLSNYNLFNVNRLGVGTALPAWPVDVETGPVNASGGYIYNGGAGVITGNCLLADSDTFHTFRVPGTCVTSLPTLYYQTVYANAVAQTQRSQLNFSSRFTLSDSSSPSRTTVDMATTAVTPGTYALPINLVVDAYGRVTGVATTTSTRTDYVWTFTSCANGTGQPSRCTGTTNLPGAMPDASYWMQCSVYAATEPSDQSITIHTYPLPTLAATNINYAMVQTMQNGTGGGVTLPVTCYAHHN